MVRTVGLRSGSPRRTPEPICQAATGAGAENGAHQDGADQEEGDQVGDQPLADHLLFAPVVGAQVNAGELSSSPPPGTPQMMMFS